MQKSRTAVVLFSGGLDSTTCLYWAQKNFAKVIALSFDYGQKHKSELIAAQAIAHDLGILHHTVRLDLAGFDNNALTNSAMPTPKHDPNAGMPTTYVPARNTVFLACALSVAERYGACDLVIGVSSVDFSGYPDCRADFIDAFARMANLGTQVGRDALENGDIGIQIHAPLQFLSKQQTLLLGRDLGVDYARTVSCYQADDLGRACGVCDSCALRRQGFLALGLDPTRYQSE